MYLGAFENMQTHILRILVLSSAFTFSYFVTTLLPTNWGDISAVQSASLIFLPHGIRVIAAWLYGWTSVLYLLPIQAYLHWARVDLVGADLGVILMPVFGLICVPLVFEIAARLGTDMRLSAGYITSWRNVVAVGGVASVINAVGSNAITGNSMQTMIFYLIGDIMGMLVLITATMLFFRMLRKAGI